MGILVRSDILAGSGDDFLDIEIEETGEREKPSLNKNKGHLGYPSLYWTIQAVISAWFKVSTSEYLLINRETIERTFSENCIGAFRRLRLHASFMMRGFSSCGRSAPTGVPHPCRACYVCSQNVS